MDEGVHDVHSLLGNTNVRVNLFKNFVDIDGEGLDSSSSGFLVSSRLSGFSLGWLLSHYSNLQSRINSNQLILISRNLIISFL